jgi:hypothetical protein
MHDVDAVLLCRYELIVCANHIDCISVYCRSLCRFHNAISPLQDTAELISHELLPPKSAASITTRYRNQVRFGSTG